MVRAQHSDSSTTSTSWVLAPRVAAAASDRVQHPEGLRRVGFLVISDPTPGDKQYVAFLVAGVLKKLEWIKVSQLKPIVRLVEERLRSRPARQDAGVPSDFADDDSARRTVDVHVEHSHAGAGIARSIPS